MKINTAEELVKSGGLGEGNAFSIAASSKAFEVLSSNLYQNKILAVVREISCNAADAHKMVGHSLSEIEAHLPSYAEPWFAVRDFGPSLSHEAVLKLYTTYFLSTKDSDNELIGGFGLGSKAPFAVADQFTVTTWRDGLKRTYVCYKQNGVPQINGVLDDRSSEPTGLEVRVAVKSHEINNWVEEAKRYYSWWPQVPSGIRNVTCLGAGDNFAVRSAGSVGAFPEWAILKQGAERDTRPRVIMGLVPYTLDFNSIPNLTTDLRQAVAGMPVLMAFDVGALSINPSRETLSYDPETCAAITRRLLSLQNEIALQIGQAISGAPSLWEARRRAMEIREQGTYLSVMLDKLAPQITWRGQQAFGAVKLRLDKDFDQPVTVHGHVKRNYRKTWFKAHTLSDEFYHHVNRGVAHVVELFYEPTITAKTYRKIAHYMETTWPEVDVPVYGGGSHKGKPNYEAVVFTGTTFDNIEKVCAAKGLPPLTKVADLPDVPAAPKGSTKAAPKTQGYSFSADGGFQLVRAPLDLTGGGIYVPFEEGFPEDNSVREAIRAGLVDADKVIGISKARLKMKSVQTLLDDNGWKPFDLDATLQAMTDKDIEEYVQYHNIHTLAYSYAAGGGDTFLKNFTQQVLITKADWKGTDLEGLATYLNSVRPFNTAKRANIWRRFSDRLVAYRPVPVKAGSKLVDDYRAALVRVMAKHPLLAHLAWSQMGLKDMGLVVDYLKRS